jgi:hypothetical protein
VERGVNPGLELSGFVSLLQSKALNEREGGNERIY